MLRIEYDFFEAHWKRIFFDVYEELRLLEPKVSAAIYNWLWGTGYFQYRVELI